MKIAVASQNRKSITGHAGKCRKFWIYQLDGQRLVDKTLLELPLQDSLHASPHDAAHPLDTVDLLICGGLGQGLKRRLEQRGVRAVATAESDPDRAVAAWLVGTLEELPAEAHDHAHADADHRHGHQPTIPVGAPAPHLLTVEQLFSRQFKESP